MPSADLLLTGIGGQGIQLCAKTLALAATVEGMDAMLTPHYGGQMRGGQTEASVVLREGTIRGVPPILPSASSALVMHAKYWPGTRERLRPSALVVVEQSMFHFEERAVDAQTVPIAAVQTADELGVPMAASFVLLAAYNEIARLVSVDGLKGAMRTLLPPYRTQHIEANERALDAGASLGRQHLAESPALHVENV